MNIDTVSMNIEAIDLFCGVGGLTRGLLDAGVSVKAGFDIDGECEYAYELNNPGAVFHHMDVADVTKAHLSRFWSKNSIRLLAGCAPCQPFSAAANAARTTKPADIVDDDGRDVETDHRYDLLDHFGRLVYSCRPEVVTMENVPRVKNHAPFERFLRRLDACGYEVWYMIVQCSDLGIPQRRRRLVLFASRIGAFDQRLEMPASSGHRTVREAIDHLPALAAGGHDPKDPTHKARSMNGINLKRMQASKPGGTWKDWPLELRSACHVKVSGASYMSVYARMHADRPSPTITTQFFNFGTGRFGHPEQDRSLTPREAAILQSFPAGYRFVEPGREVFLSTLGRMIGNAVPPRLGEAIGRTVVRHVKSAAVENLLTRLRG